MVRAGIKEAHPAGIWSDLSVDGPVIGTLIVVLDKAKNLPNRKKIGKQDPYAVARLGKEAKRTDSDIRGGQTPRWDKELRFPVRNSPDYKSLKISVFNDDKKTDLIGETTLRLDKILVKGGGTDDGWRGLKCKEKYAGEILVELTFWDMRPKDGPVIERKRAEQNSRKEKEREREAPRKVGGAREMANPRERMVSRRPLPADPTRSSKDDVGPPVLVPEKRTRRSRHSYHPGVEDQQHHPHHSLPEPSPSHYRDNRAPPRGIAIAPDPSPVTHGAIYDPSGDNYIPGGDIFGRFEEDNDPHGQPAPPPPPAHRRPYDASPGYHSPVVPPPPHQTIHKRHQSQHQLKHYQSVPDWQHREQHNQDPDGRELYRSSSYDPRIPEQHSGSYPGLQNRYPPQDEHDNYPPSADTRASIAHLRQGGGVVYQDESPGLSHGPTPASSFENFGMDIPDDAPPPPPPPHGHSPVPTRPDEPNWVNLKPKTKSEDDLGLPSYEVSTQLAHRRSYSNMDSYELERRRRPSVGMDVSLTRNGMPIPPSLVPGIDPVVAEQMAVREGTERRSSFVGMSSHPLQIEAPPQTRAMQHSSSQNQNYHRPQVEEVQDVQLYQPQLLPEDQVVGRPVTVKKGRERTAAMVKPIPIHGERDDAVPAIGATPTSVKRNATLVMVAPDRKPVPQKDPPFEGLPFSPDSFDLINPGPSAALEAAINGPGATYNTPQEAEETSRRRAAESKRGKLPSKMIMPGSKRVLDGSDVLPPESFAPEPEKRGGRKPRPPPPVPAEYRRHSTGRGRSPSPQPPRRGERLALTGPEPGPPPPIPKKVSIRSPSPDPDRAQRRERAKLQKKLRNSQSMAVLPSNSRNYGSSRDRYSIGPGAMVMYNPESERERQWERERDSRALVPTQGNDRYGYNLEQPPRYASGGGGMDVGWHGGSGSRPPQALPPVPAKVPIQQGSTVATTAPPGMSREDFLLSQEMSLIDIGPSSGGRTRRGRY